jgi:general secretion pathway protein F
MAGLSLGFITTTVLPQFRPMLAEAGVQLTVSAEVLFSIGDLLTNHWLTLLLGAFVAGTALVVVIRQPASRLWIDGRLLRAPAVGPFLREAAAAQYCRLLAMLHGNGIPLPAAIGIAAEAVGSPTLQAALRHVQTKVKEGRGLAGTLQETGLCPPLVIHLVRVGEETGRLSEMLLRAADLLDERLQHMTERFTALLVPVLTLVIGVVIAVAVTSVFSALLSLNEAIQ